MLVRLVIQNLALIEHAELEPSPGLSVFTGETGAGKTMLAQAIGLLAGGQPGSALVGPHAEEAYVEAEFELPDGLLDDPALAPVADLRPEGEETLVVARRVFASGRTRAWCGGAAARAPTWRRSVIACSSCHPSTRPSGSRNPLCSSLCWTATPRTASGWPPWLRPGPTCVRRDRR